MYAQALAVAEINFLMPPAAKVKPPPGLTGVK
jgi:hypothetical protein